jgi:hypothetical protein
MTYSKAESMRQEINVALQYQDMFPNKFREVAKKYSADQWVECGKAIIEKIEQDKVNLFGLMILIDAARKEA